MRFLAILMAVFVTNGCGTTARDTDQNPTVWTIIPQIPGKFHGEYVITSIRTDSGEITSSGNGDDSGSFMVGKTTIFPVMFPDAYWKIKSIEQREGDSHTIRILSHSANQPASEATFFTITLVNMGKLHIQFEKEEVSSEGLEEIIMVKRGNLTGLFKDL